MNKEGTLLQQFEALEIPAPDFHHEDHVRVAFEMLGAYDFVEACSRYATTIQAMARRVDAPEKFNMTITVAFMSVVAERKADSGQTDAEAFLAENVDLLDKDLLQQWYSDKRLSSPHARSQFLLPDIASQVR